MKAKLFLIFLIYLVSDSAVFAQGRAKPQINIIYVDNSSAVGDGLTGAMITSMVEMMDTLAGKGKFLFFMSGKRPKVLTTKGAVDDLLNDLSGKYADQQFPVQDDDVVLLRKNLIDMVNNFDGNINMYFFVTNKFASSLIGKYSPLVGLFPKELAHFYNDDGIVVNVTVNYPKIANSRLNPAEIKSTLDFNSGVGPDRLITYTVN